MAKYNLRVESCEKDTKNGKIYLNKNFVAASRGVAEHIAEIHYNNWNQHKPEELLSRPIIIINRILELVQDYDLLFQK